MSRDISYVAPMHHRDDALETALIEDYLRMRGYDPSILSQPTDPQALMVIIAARKHAAEQLAVVACRAHFVNDLHGAKGSKG